ncbi:hypothetical protein FRB99_008951 [Tulasnella sp. 403]|nr:hypothetical protein FRB99_008951 [Tulasnella sp. 403]
MGTLPDDDDAASLTLDDPDSTRVTFDREQIVASGSYCDLFIGTDSKGQKISVKRYRITIHGYTEDDLRVLEVASALVYLESKDVIHGDIKAANILVSPDHHALLCDVGLSKIVSVTTQKSLKGAGATPWQSPELLKNEPKSYASDIYAFGITIYEVRALAEPLRSTSEFVLAGIQVLTGSTPFPGWEVTAIMYAVIHDNKRPTKPAIHKSQVYLWDIAEQCWKKDADERPSIQTVLRWIQQRKCDPRERDGPQIRSSSSSPEPTAGSRRPGVPHGSRHVGSQPTNRGASNDLPSRPRHPSSDSISSHTTLSRAGSDAGRRALQQRPAHRILRSDNSTPSVQTEQSVTGGGTGVIPAERKRVGTKQGGEGSRRVSFFEIDDLNLDDEVVTATVPLYASTPAGDGDRSRSNVHSSPFADSTVPTAKESLAPSTPHQTASGSLAPKPLVPRPPHRLSDSRNGGSSPGLQHSDLPGMLGGSTTREAKIDTPGDESHGAASPKTDRPSRTQKEADLATLSQGTHLPGQLSTLVSSSVRARPKEVIASKEMNVGHDATPSNSRSSAEPAVIKPDVAVQELSSASTGSKKDKVFVPHHPGSSEPHPRLVVGNPSHQLAKGALEARPPPHVEKDARRGRPNGSLGADSLQNSSSLPEQSLQSPSIGSRASENKPLDNVGRTTTARLNPPKSSPATAWSSSPIDSVDLRYTADAKRSRQEYASDVLPRAPGSLDALSNSCDFAPPLKETDVFSPPRHHDRRSDKQSDVRQSDRVVYTSPVRANVLQQASLGSKKGKGPEQSHCGSTEPHSRLTAGDLSELTTDVGARLPALADRAEPERRPKGSSSAGPPQKFHGSPGQPTLSTLRTESRVSRHEGPSQPSQLANPSPGSPAVGLQAIDSTGLVEAWHPEPMESASNTSQSGIPLVEHSLSFEVVGETLTSPTLINPEDFENSPAGPSSRQSKPSKHSQRKAKRAKW